MKKTTRRPASRPSRATGSASRALSARKRPAARRSGATAIAASARSATKAGSRRCEAPNCSNSFKPKSDRQIYCSPACKVRAFYWAYKEQAGERYAARYERERRRTSAKASASTRGGRRPAARRKASRT